MLTSLLKNRTKSSHTLSWILWEVSLDFLVSLLPASLAPPSGKIYYLYHFTAAPKAYTALIFASSTLSTVLNGMALTVLEDFVRPFAPNLNDNTATKISKGISFGFGLISYLMVFLVSNVNSILEVSVK